MIPPTWFATASDRGQRLLYNRDSGTWETCSGGDWPAILLFQGLVREGKAGSSFSRASRQPAEGGSLLSMPLGNAGLKHAIQASFGGRSPRSLVRLLAALLAATSFATSAFPEDVTNSAPSAKFQWGHALAESFLAFTIAHAERFSREPGTRESIQGRFWPDYVRDIQSLHGWQDGDGILSSYVAHPMEGAMAGFIERQNDPKFRTVEFGVSQRYWTSVVRSLAFSTLYNIAWSLSPYGEAGLGDVDLHAPPGLVDPVGSELMGTAWMIGEDAVDRFLIRRIENRYENRVARAFARAGLNPIRSYSNLLRFKVPWYRDARSINSQKPEGSYAPSENSTGPEFKAREWPYTAFELFGQSYVQRNTGSSGSTCLGGGGEGSVKLSNQFAMVFDVDGCTLLGMHAPDSGDMLTYATGPRWSSPEYRRWVPYLQVLVGGAKITRDHVDVAKKNKDTKIAVEMGQPEPPPYQFTSEADTNGFTVLAGGGLSYQMTDLLSFRVAQVTYQRSWVSTLDDCSYTNGLRFTFGVALKFGPWREPL